MVYLVFTDIITLHKFLWIPGDWDHLIGKLWFIMDTIFPVSRRLSLAFFGGKIKRGRNLELMMKRNLFGPPFSSGGGDMIWRHRRRSGPHDYVIAPSLTLSLSLPVQPRRLLSRACLVFFPIYLCSLRQPAVIYNLAIPGELNCSSITSTASRSQINHLYDTVPSRGKLKVSFDAIIERQELPRDFMSNNFRNIFMIRRSTGHAVSGWDGGHKFLSHLCQ